MLASTAVTIDLDGTLLLGTQADYDEARQAFADQLANQFDHVSVDDALETQREYSGALLDEYGLSKERFPEACVRAATDLADPSTDFQAFLRSVGEAAFKSQQTYADRGLADGADELFATATARANVSILTAGDSEIQQRKLDALSIPDSVDARIVGLGEKADTLTALLNEYDRVIHIGNSASSDVGAAAAAGADCIYVPNEEWRDDDIDRNGIGHFRVADNLVEAEQQLAAYLNPPAIH